jgi:hypothetical protein
MINVQSVNKQEGVFAGLVHVLVVIAGHKVELATERRPQFCQVLRRVRMLGMLVARLDGRKIIIHFD